MLLRVSLPGSFEADLKFGPDIGNKDFPCDWMPGPETWQKCLQTDQPGSVCKMTVADVEMNNDDPCSFNFSRSNTQMSTYSAMPGNSAPAFVYHRRKQQRNSASVDPAKTSITPVIVYHRRKPRRNSVAFVYHRRKPGKKSAAICPAQTSANTKNTEGFHSVISSEAHSMATRRCAISDLAVDKKSTDVLPVQCNTKAADCKSVSFTGYPDRGAPCSEEILRNHNNPGALATYCIIDSCSSSKSNLDLDSSPPKIDVEDLGECSSSDALAAERFKNEMSERAICTISARGSAEDVGTSSDNCRLRSCKVCQRSENPIKMIVCDNCEDAFHLSCCKPYVEEVAEDEWFCDSCTKEKHETLKEKCSNSSRNNSSEIDRDSSSASEDVTGRISLMLKDTRPYKSSVRIGREFQAEVPDWSGPIIDKVHPVCEPLDLNVAESVPDSNCEGSPRISFIGNWIQCREVIEGIGEGAEGIICGKWRRAPLFEVQTDNWECFRCILWDPYHADCAVPQELDTDEVVRQLKYVEMLRPRLAAKRRKFDRTKPASSLRIAEV